MTWFTTCVIDGCNTKPRVRGHCSKHYTAERRAGTLRNLPTMTMEERFWSKVEKTDACWLWRGAIHYSGYGHFNPTPKKTVRAHRFAYELVKGPIPDGLVLDHLCRVRHCVNPEHLEPVTGAENTRRGIWPNPGRKRQEVCSKGHDDWVTKKSGARHCRTCARDYLAKRERADEYANRKAARSSEFWPTVRAWAIENGLEVSARGPLAKRVVDAYLQRENDR